MKTIKRKIKTSLSKQILSLTLIAVIGCIPASAANEELNWPREINVPEAKIMMYQPQLESFEKNKITAKERKAAIAASIKPHVLVLDFVGNSGRHKLITTADVLGGKYEDAIIERAVRNAKEKGGEVDMLEELKAAQEEAKEERKRKRKSIKAKATYHRTVINAFDIFDVTPVREPGWHKGRRPTEKMRNMLERAGVEKVSDMSFWKAKQLIGKMFERREKKLCTYKQAKILDKYGEGTEVSFEQASNLITQIKNNGWKPL